MASPVIFLEPFEGPYLKLERAGFHLVDLTLTVGEYQDRSPPEFVKTDRQANPWELQLSEPVPNEIPLQVGDIAHSLRSALDVMMCDIAILRGAGLSDMSYPFAESEEKFKEMLAGRPRDHPFKKLGDDVIKLVEESQPYKGGNRLLRGLHDLNNQDKHRMAVPWVQFASFTLDTRHQMKKLLGDNVEVFSMGGPPVGLDIGEPIPDETFGDHPADSWIMNQRPMRVCFPSTYVLHGEILPTMQQLVDTVFNLVQSFDKAVLRA